MKKIVIVMMVSMMCVLFCSCGSAGNESVDICANDAETETEFCENELYEEYEAEEEIECAAEDEEEYAEEEYAVEDDSDDETTCEESEEEYAAEDCSEDELTFDEDEDWYTLDEAKALAENDTDDEVSDVFIKDGDKYYALTKPSYADVSEEYSGDKGSVRGVHYVFNLIGDNEPVVLSEGMELINVQCDMPAEIISLEGRTGYTDEVLFHMIHDDEWMLIEPNSQNMYFTETGSESISEIDDQALDGPTDNMVYYLDINGESNGYDAILDMDEEETICFGRYEGVDYIEDYLTANDEYYLPDHGFNVTELEAGITKSGYAEIDTSGVENGLYCIFDSSSYGTHDAFWIQISR